MEIQYQVITIKSKKVSNKKSTHKKAHIIHILIKFRIISYRIIKK